MNKKRHDYFFGTSDGEEMLPKLIAAARRNMGRKRTANACVEVQRTGTITSFREKYSGALHLRNGTGYLGYKYLAALPLLKPKPLKILSEMGAERPNGAINGAISTSLPDHFRK